MKSFFKKLSFVLAAAMVVTMMPANTAKAADLKTAFLIDQNTAYTNAVAEKAVVLTVGDTSKDFKFVGIDDYTKTGKGWSSSNEAVATVNKVNGKVTAVAPGTTTISYKATGYEDATCTVVVVDKDTKTVALKDQKGGDAQTTLTVDQAAVDYKFDGCAEWATAKSHVAYFDSSDDSVLACTNAKAGIFEARKEGKATVTVAVVCDGKVCHTGSIEVTVKKAVSLSVVQTTKDTAVLTFASESAAAAAVDKITVERFNPDQKTLTPMRSVQTQDKNTVKVQLYTNYDRNTDYVFTASEGEVKLSVGALVVDDLKIIAVDKNTRSEIFAPATDAEVVVNALAKDEAGNVVDLGSVWIGTDDVTLRTEDFAKGSLSGHDLFINNAADPFTVVATYAGVTKSATFVAVAETFNILGINKAAIARQVADDGGVYTDITDDSFTSGAITFPMGDEARLYLEIKTDGKYLVTNNYTGLDPLTHDYIENTKYYNNDVYTISYESKNPNILMIHPVDGTTKAVGVGPTEILVYVTKTSATGVATPVKIGSVKVNVTEARKLTSVTPLPESQYQSTLNSGNFTNVTYSFKCLDQYGAPIAATFQDIFAQTTTATTVTDKTMVQRNNVTTSSYPTIDTATVVNAPLSVATLLDGTAGIAKITLKCANVTNYDRYTLKVKLKDTENSNTVKTAYSYLKVVNGLPTGTVDNRTVAKIVMVKSNVTASYVPANIYDVNDILSATGSYTYNMINGQGIANTAVPKIAVVTYVQGLPFEVETFTVLDEANDNITTPLNVGTNDLEKLLATVATNEVANTLVPAAPASVYAARDIQTLNASALKLANTNVFVMTVKNNKQDAYNGNANLLSITNKKDSNAIATVSLAHDRQVSDKYNTILATTAAVVTANPAGVQVVTRTGEIKDHKNNYATTNYSLELKAPFLTLTDENNDRRNDTVKFTWGQTIPGTQFTLTMNRNVVNPTIITKSNTSTRNNSMDASEVLYAVLDKVTAPVGKNGEMKTFVIDPENTRIIDGTTKLSTVQTDDEVGQIDITIHTSTPNVGKDGYTVVGIFVKSVDVKVTLTDKDNVGNTVNYTVELGVNQYVQY